MQSQGVQFYLGTFDSEEEAAKAYDKKAREEKGEKSQTNYDHLGTETGVCQLRSFADKPTDSFIDNSFYSDTDGRINGQLYLSPRLLLQQPASDQIRVMWDRLSQLTQRYMLANATREKLLELQTSSSDNEKAVLLRSLEEECSLLAVVRSQLEEALARSLSCWQMFDSSGNENSGIGALSDCSDHHGSSVWWLKPTGHMGGCGASAVIGIPFACSAAAASYPSSSAHARVMYTSVTGVADDLSSAWGHYVQGSMECAQKSGADQSVDRTVTLNAQSTMAVGFSEKDNVALGPLLVTDAKDCVRRSAASLGAGTTITTSSTISGSDGDE